jgi:hypothetical protein
MLKEVEKTAFGNGKPCSMGINLSGDFLNKGDALSTVCDQPDLQLGIEGSLCDLQSPLGQPSTGSNESSWCTIDGLHMIRDK